MRFKYLHRGLLITFFICQSTYSQISTSNFNNSTHYTIKDGLSSSIVNSIIEDEKGFLWVATNKGVALFDGKHFTNYNFFNLNGVTQKIGFIEKIILDKSKKTLWLSGENGIFYSSIDIINFKKLNALSINTNSPLNKTRFILFKDQNTLWSSSDGKGLLKIDIKNKNYKNFIFKNFTNSDQALLNSIGDIYKDPNNDSILWLGTGAGLIRFNRITEEYQVFIYKNNSDLAQNLIRKIAVTKDFIFLGTWSEGLVVFNKKSREFSQPLKALFPESSLILGFYKDQNNLWITTGKGLIEYNTLSNTINNSLFNKPNKSAIYGVSFIDKKGIIWFGDGKGLFKYNPKYSNFKFIQLEERSNLESPFLVRKIIRLNGFIYVIGQSGSGLYKINPKDYSFEVFKISDFNNDKITNWNLRDMVAMDNENLLILSHSKLYKFNIKTQTFSLSPLQINHPSSSLQSLIKDTNNIYWVGSRLGGLTSLNFINNTVTTYKDDFNIYKEGNHIWINKLYLDSSNKLWIAKGTQSVIDLNNLNLSIINPKDSVPYYQDVNGFLEGFNNRIWVANYKNGLGYLNFNEFNKGVIHLFDGKFSGIYKYKDSILWTTGNGLLGQYFIKTNKHKTVTVNNNSQYIRGPIINNEKDEYLIGCNNGILIYKPKKQEIKQEIPIPYIRKIIGNGITIYEGNDLVAKNLKFKSGTNQLVISVSALGFQQPETTSYFYKFQDEWITLKTTKDINFTNLKSGNYTFEIKACNSTENCSTTVYNLIIPTPWYRSWWAYILYFLLISFIGITLYKLDINKKLALAEKNKLQEIDTLKTELYGNISHEFRTPLTVITGLSSLLIEENKNNVNTEKIKGIHQSGNQLLKLVNQLLDLVLIDVNKTKVNYKNADIIPFLKKCVSLFKFYADSKNQQLKFNISLQTLTMDFDDDKLQKILNNVISNAIKFTPENGIITVLVEEINNQLIINITDNGPGIAPQHLPHIFERYYKTFDSSSNIGSGIGMALTKKLVNLLKGTITVKSKLQKGTTFTINLPINNNTTLTNKVSHKIPFVESSINKDEQIDNLSQKKQLKYSILIVEDNSEIRNYLKILLKESYMILEAKNGVEGLKIALTKKTDFIISDLIMPEMDGYEFCKKIKNNINTSHVPFIIISAKSETEEKLKGHKLGIDAYLTKPFNKDELKLIIGNLLQKKEVQLNYFSKLLKLKKENTSQNINQLDINLITNLQEKVLNYNNKQSVDDLAKSLFTSRTQLHRKITSLTGMSVTKYINHIRIEKAKYLLKNTELNSNEIAYQIGFESSSYFSRIFKKEVGDTPASYRENNS